MKNFKRNTAELNPTLRNESASQPATNSKENKECPTLCRYRDTDHFAWLLRSAQVRDQVPGRKIYRLIRAFGFASRRDSGSKIGRETEPKGSASIQCPYSLRSYVTERYLDTGAYPRKMNAVVKLGTKRYADEGASCSGGLIAKHFPGPG